MMKGLGTFDSGCRITTYCACTQGLNITITIFRKRRKGTEKGKDIISKIYSLMASFYFLKAYKGEGQNLLQFNVCGLCERAL